MQYYLPLLKKELEKDLEFYSHLSDRLDTPYCLMLVYSEEFLDDSHQKIAQVMRRIDCVKRIDKRSVAILFFVSQSQHQEVVINRVINFLQESCHAKRYHIGIACSNEDSDDILVRALQNMLEARDENRDVVYDF